MDEERTPDVFKKLIRELGQFKNTIMVDDIKEKESFDWRAERQNLPTLLSQTSLQHSFIPRLGELVLWCPYWPDELDLVFNPKTGFYQFYSFEQETFLGFPDWRGGVIAATPSSAAADGTLDFPDILSNPKKNASPNQSGFRVETFPDPNNDYDKFLSKHYRYVPLRQIRPLSHWQSLLRGINERKQHPSIKYALTCTTTVSLVEKFRFKGDWPHAAISCKGIYLGAEFLIVGDAVRILSPDQPLSLPDTATPTPPARNLRCTDVLVITAIFLNLLDITLEHCESETPGLSTTSSITIFGHAYTADAKRDYRLPKRLDKADHTTLPPPLDDETVKSAFPVVGAAEYGSWYPLHASNQRYEVSFNRILGRLHEPDAVRLWMGMSQTKQSVSSKPRPSPTLSYDFPAILSARRYGMMTDERIPRVKMSKEILFYWADTRAQALSLETLNGEFVGPYDPTRDIATVKSWRAILKVIDGTASQQDFKNTRLPQQKGRQKGSKMVDGKVVGPFARPMIATDDDWDSETPAVLGGAKEKRLSLSGSSSHRVRGMSMSGASGGGGIMSSMVGAALEDGEDESTDVDIKMIRGDDSGAEVGEEDEDVGETSSRLLGQFQGGVKQMARKHTLGYEPNFRPTGPATKVRIMQSVEPGGNDGGDGGSDDDHYHNKGDREYDNGGEDLDKLAIEELYGPVPLARGGTEESEGGDYHPAEEGFEKRRGSVGSSGRKRARS